MTCLRREEPARGGYFYVAAWRGVWPIQVRAQSADRPFQGVGAEEDGPAGDRPQSNAAPCGPGQSSGPCRLQPGPSATRSRPAAYRLSLIVVVASITLGAIPARDAVVTRFVMLRRRFAPVGCLESVKQTSAHASSMNAKHRSEPRSHRTARASIAAELRQRPLQVHRCRPSRGDDAIPRRTIRTVIPPRRRRTDGGTALWQRASARLPPGLPARPRHPGVAGCSGMQPFGAARE